MSKQVSVACKYRGKIKRNHNKRIFVHAVKVNNNRQKIILNILSYSCKILLYIYFIIVLVFRIASIPHYSLLK